jgi:hypothetical protein
MRLRRHVAAWRAGQGMSGSPYPGPARRLRLQIDAVEPKHRRVHAVLTFLRVS